MMTLIHEYKNKKCKSKVINVTQDEYFVYSSKLDDYNGSNASFTDNIDPFVNNRLRNLIQSVKYSADKKYLFIEFYDQDRYTNLIFDIRTTFPYYCETGNYTITVYFRVHSMEELS